MIIQFENVATSVQFIRLAKLNRFWRELFLNCMKVPAVKKLVARVEEHKRFKDELRGYAYIKKQPNSTAPTESEIIGPSQFELLLLLPSVKLVKEDGSFIERTLTLMFTPHDRHIEHTWKLHRTSTCGDLEVSIKRAESDVWTRVDFGPGAPNGGTSFRDRDQLNVRYVHGNQSRPVSFDGTWATNIFPVTFHIIGPANTTPDI